MLEPKGLKMAEETRYLVLDSRLIADVEDAKLTLGKVSKHPENPLFTEDKPWEPRYDNVYPDVIYDEDEKSTSVGTTRLSSMRA